MQSLSVIAVCLADSFFFDLKPIHPPLREILRKIPWRGIC